MSTCVGCQTLKIKTCVDLRTYLSLTKVKWAQVGGQAKSKLNTSRKLALTCVWTCESDWPGRYYSYFPPVIHVKRSKAAIKLSWPVCIFPRAFYNWLLFGIRKREGIAAMNLIGVLSLKDEVTAEGVRIVNVLWNIWSWFCTPQVRGAIEELGKANWDRKKARAMVEKLKDKSKGYGNLDKWTGENLKK